MYTGAKLVPMVLVAASCSTWLVKLSKNYVQICCECALCKE